MEEHGVWYIVETGESILRGLCSAQYEDGRNWARQPCWPLVMNKKDALELAETFYKTTGTKTRVVRLETIAVHGVFPGATPEEEKTGHIRQVGSDFCC